MGATLGIVALISFLAGYFLGRESRKQEPRRCPKCNHRRLYWCRGCGLHFDDDDRAMTHGEYERLTATDALFEDQES